MVWVVLVLAGVSWLVVVLISQQERGETAPRSAGASVGLAGIRKELPRVARRAAHLGRRALTETAGMARRAGEASAGVAGRAIHRPLAARRGATLDFARVAARAAPARRARGEGWRNRVIALLELILFVLLVSALFAGVIAAAALRIGHLGA